MYGLQYEHKMAKNYLFKTSTSFRKRTHLSFLIPFNNQILLKRIPEVVYQGSFLHKSKNLEFRKVDKRVLMYRISLYSCTKIMLCIDQHVKFIWRKFDTTLPGGGGGGVGFFPCLNFSY
jgi:hypothetical protein